MNTNDYEIKTIKPYERTVLNVGLLDSGLVQLKEENKIFFYSFTWKDYVKGRVSFV